MEVGLNLISLTMGSQDGKGWTTTPLTFASLVELAECIGTAMACWDMGGY